MSTTPLSSTSRMSPQRGLAHLRATSGRNTHADQFVLWRAIGWQGALLAVAATLLPWSPWPLVVVAGALTVANVGLIVYNAIFWVRARRLWESYGPAKQAMIETKRGTPMADDLARSAVIRRTNLASFVLSGIALVAALMLLK